MNARSLRVSTSTQNARKHLVRLNAAARADLKATEQLALQDRSLVQLPRA